MNVLNEACVTKDIVVDLFNEVVSNITTSNYLNFRNGEWPTEGIPQNKALYIYVKCHDNILTGVLVNIGSSLNVMPKTALAELFIDRSYMKPTITVVKTFDGSRRTIIKEINLSIQIWPHIFEITF